MDVFGEGGLLLCLALQHLPPKDSYPARLQSTFTLFQEPLQNLNELYKILSKSYKPESSKFHHLRNLKQV